MATATHPIPQPPGKPLVGNLPDFMTDEPLVLVLMNMSHEYGPLFALDMPKQRLLVAAGVEVVNTICNEQAFDKVIGGPLQNVRAFAGDGLFTAWTSEPNWEKAHNILLPTFSQRAIRGYLPQMIDLARQLCDRWQRTNPDEDIDVAADMTRLTLDTIGLCGFNYRFNSFYRETPHPFIVAMVDALAEAQRQTQRLAIQERLAVRVHRHFQDDITTMNELTDRLIQERKLHPPDPEIDDLLNHMLTGVDKVSGESLDDLNIRYQMITFLIAGHETTSGLLSFAIYFLLKHPAVLARAYAEVDQVLGADLTADPTVAQLQQLPYVYQILKESLRLWPTAPGFTRAPREDTIVGDGWQLPKQQPIFTNLPSLHRDKSVWGEDAEAFNPDHFLPERERALPPHAYKPFGTGQRACIGRQFALQEAQLALAMVLQRFELRDPHDYQLRIKQTLTIKPEGLLIRVQPRRERATPRTIVIPAPVVIEDHLPEAATDAPAYAAPAGHGTPLLVLYGSNLGTAAEIAQQIGNDGTVRGYQTTVAPLDDYTARLPTAGAVVIVSASYNGTPPDNAATFCAWLSGDLAPSALTGVHYSVFGCGNRDWAATYQAIPTLIDQELAAHGATRVHPRGEGDARDDFDGQFRTWYGTLWSDLSRELAIPGAEAVNAVAQGHRFEVEPVPAAEAMPLAAAYGAVPFAVVENRELQQGVNGDPPARSTRHLAFTLPAGMTYRTGDYLGVLPRNDPALVERVLTRLALDGAQVVRIRGNQPTKTTLPLDRPITIGDLLQDYVELQEPASRSQLAVLAAYTSCPPERDQLAALASDAPADTAQYREQVLDKRVSLLDLLTLFPSVNLPLNIFLELLNPLKPRYYSISSSPLADAAQCTATVGVVAGPARSGLGGYHGTCSGYLAGQAAGGAVPAFIQAPSTPFRPPVDPMTSMIMVGPGTGLAPFRGFLQDRAAIAARGEPVGPSLLFFGCRAPAQDFIYQAEMEAFAAAGLVELYTAFSRDEPRSKQYVQDRLLAEQARVWALLEAGAVVYVCGDASRMAPAVRRAFAEIYRAQTGGDEQAATAWLAELDRATRYVADVWSA